MFEFFRKLLLVYRSFELWIPDCVFPANLHVYSYHAQYQRKTEVSKLPEQVKIYETHKMYFRKRFIKSFLHTLKLRNICAGLYQPPSIPSNWESPRSNKRPEVYFHRYWRMFVGLLLKQRFKPPKLKYETLEISKIFINP